MHYGAGKKQWNAPPEVAKRTERQVKFFSGSASLCKTKTKKKVEERITPLLLAFSR